MFTPMAAILPEAKSGDCKIDHFEVNEEDAKIDAIRSIFARGRTSPIRPGKYVRLRVGSTLMMTDTPNEQDTNRGFVHRANGDVLIGGLGIGMVLIPVLRKPEVRSVLVIEKYEDVISMVEPWILNALTNREGAKLQIICEDIFDWKLPPRNSLRIPGTRDTLVGRWDTIYFDIWSDICGDNLPEITKLKRRFARRLNRDNSKAWMGAWQEAVLRYRQ